MLRTYLYLPANLEKKINFTAKTQKRSKAEVMRQALEKGIAAIFSQNTASAEVLLKIAALGKKGGIKGPKDSSTKMDTYLWDNDWSNSE